MPRQKTTGEEKKRNIRGKNAQKSQKEEEREGLGKGTRGGTHFNLEKGFFIVSSQYDVM